MIICQSSNLAKANITLIKEENVNSSFLSHLGSCYNCLYYTKLIFLLKKKNNNKQEKKKKTPFSEFYPEYKSLSYGKTAKTSFTKM